MEKQTVRLVASSDSEITQSDEFTLTVGLSAETAKQYTMKKTVCTECYGAGHIKLFISAVACNMCMGAGYYAEGSHEPSRL